MNARPYFHRLGSINQYTPGSSPAVVDIDLSVIPDAVSKHWVYHCGTIIEFVITVDNPSTGAAIPIENLYRSVQALAQKHGLYGTIIADNVSGSDLAHYFNAQLNGERLIDFLAQDEIPVPGTGTVTYTRRFYLLVDGLDSRLSREEAFGQAKPSVGYRAEDKISITTAPSTVFAGISTGAVFKSVAIRAQALLMFSKTLKYPTKLRRFRSETFAAGSQIKVGPFVDAPSDIAEGAFCSSLIGLGGLDTLEKHTALSSNAPDISNLDTRYLINAFARRRAQYIVRDPYIFGATISNGELLDAELAYMPFRFLGKKAQIADVPEGSGPLVLTVTTTSTAGHRLLVMTWDRFGTDKSGELAQMAAAVAAAK